jgi:hypothetical protein
MKTKELQRIDSNLETLSNISKILKAKKGFYIYFNAPTSGTRVIKIHKHTCGYCAWGSGNGRDAKETGKNGVWIGPFSLKEQAKKFANSFFQEEDIPLHSCCAKSKRK